MRKFFFCAAFIYTLFFVDGYVNFFSFTKKDHLYITPGLFGWMGETTNHPGIPFYGHHLPTIFKKYGFRVKTAKDIKKLKRLNKLVVLEVMLEKTKYYKRHPSRKMVLFLWEPPSVLPQNYEKKYHKYFSKVYTWDDDLVDGKRYFKFFYPEMKPMMRSQVAFQDKKLCTLISRNKSSKHKNELYSERKKVIRFFEENAPGDFDLYGQGWSKKEFASYRGEIPTKECLFGYRFCFAYENITNIKGYITEKIFDAFRYGCVPVYLGADNISDYVPKNCFVDRREFASEKELYTYLKNMDEKVYLEYLQNIEEFLQSDKAKLFSTENFLTILKNAFGVEQDS